MSYQKYHFYLHKKEEARVWILHFHGNAGAACHRAFYIKELSDVEANIILAEYPGYSNDPKKSTERSILNNARALFHYLQSINTNNLPIILYGESLGCGVAINLALREKVAGLILQTPYTSISDIARVHYPFLPIRWLIKNNFPANTWAKEVYTKVLILHGVKDDIIPIKIGRRLVTNFPHPPQFEEFSEFGHNDLNLGNPKYWQVVKDFISQITD